MTTAIARTADQLRVIEDVSATLCVDESYSMHDVAEATRKSVNAYIETLQTGALITLAVATFGPQTNWIRPSAPSDTIRPLALEDYIPSGGTLLRDTLGAAIEREDERLIPAVHPIIAVFTDGGDTNSKKYTNEMLKEMIDDRTARGWTFIAFVAGEAARRATESYGFLPENMVQYTTDDASTQLAFQRLTRSTVRLAKAVEMRALPPSKFLD